MNTTPSPAAPSAPLRGLVPALALALLAGACAPDAPSGLLEPAFDVNAEEPSFTPFTVAPVLENADGVIEALGRAYPDALREAGIGGTAQIWFLIDSDGSVRNVVLNRSSGLEELDEAAIRVAHAFEFRPAENEGTTVPVWVSLPITFGER